MMPLVRFPLVSLLPPNGELKALCSERRSAVVKDLVDEALNLQVNPAALATFTGAQICV